MWLLVRLGCSVRVLVCFVCCAGGCSVVLVGFGWFGFFVCVVVWVLGLCLVVFFVFLFCVGVACAVYMFFLLGVPTFFWLVFFVLGLVCVVWLFFCGIGFVFGFVFVVLWVGFWFGVCVGACI